MGIQLTHKNIHINRRLLIAKGEISGFGLCVLYEANNVGFYVCI